MYFPTILPERLRERVREREKKKREREKDDDWKYNDKLLKKVRKC